MPPLEALNKEFQLDSLPQNAYSMMSSLHSETLQGEKKFEDDSTMGLKWFQNFRKHAISNTQRCSRHEINVTKAPFHCQRLRKNWH